MRITWLLVYLVMSVSLVLANDLEVITETEKTEDSVITTNIYTRKGVKILWVQKTDKPDRGKLLLQRVYHNNKIAIEIIDIHTGGKADGLAFSVKSGNDCEVGTHFTPDGKLKDVALMTKAIIIEGFTVKEGILCPMQSSEIERTNKVGQDIKNILNIDNVKKSTPDEFRQQIEKLIEKHKKE